MLGSEYRFAIYRSSVNSLEVSLSYATSVAKVEPVLGVCVSPYAVHTRGYISYPRQLILPQGSSSVGFRGSCWESRIKYSPNNNIAKVLPSGVMNLCMFVPE